MALLFRHYFNIAFLMRPPQDLPAGASQLRVAVLLGFFSYVAAAGLLETPPLAIARALLDLGLSALVFHVALRIVGRPERFAQAYGALCGAGSIINLAALPVFLSRGPVVEGQTSGLAMFAEFLFLVWSLSLLAHILRHTFELGRFSGTAAAFAYLVLFLTVSNSLLPAPAMT